MARINFVGDVALFSEYEVQQCDPFGKMVLPESNFNVANFEFPVAPVNAKKNFFDVDDNYRVSEEYSRRLGISNFQLYSLANNHIADYGAVGMNKTIEIIEDSGSLFFGIGKDSFNSHACSIEGVDFLFIACVKDGRWSRLKDDLGPDAYDIDALIKYIELQRGIYDHIIVYPHWGTELVDAPDPADVINARKLIDKGVSCVIGHHPHVSQGCEIYNNGLIAYSLGSFIYLPDFEKGNIDRSSDRDVSICLNVEFSKSSILGYTPYKYKLNKITLTPVCADDFRLDGRYEALCRVIGNSKYYSKRVRVVLLKREFISFIARFKESPLYAISHYFKYVKIKHFKKILGLS